MVARLKHAHWTKPNAIWQGDFNCVVSPSHDVNYGDSSAEAVAKARTNHCTHGSALEDCMASKGLTDMFRRFAGEDAREFTRHGATVLTRLDRFYGMSLGSTLVWNDVGVNVDFGRRGRHSSDHFALFATVSQHAPVVTKSPIERIDPSTIEDPKMHRLITNLWKGIYTKYDTKEYGHSQVWEIFKTHLYDMLILASKDKRNDKGRGTTAFLKRMRSEQVATANTHGPSQQHLDKMKQLDELIMKGEEASQPPRGIKALHKIEMEERSTKSFFQLFKQKFSTTGIMELFITPDWNDPNTTTGTATLPTEILKEATAYYTHLFRRRQSVRNDRLLELIRRRQFTAQAAKSMDTPLTREEVRRAAASLSNGKSPGPDEIPAEFYKIYSDMIAQELLAKSTKNSTQREPSTTLSKRAKSPSSTKRRTHATYATTDPSLY